jgi:tetratricopeptide (TPR) repeat protein
MKSLRLVVVSLLLSTVLAPAASVAEKEKNSVFEFALRGAQDALTKGNTGEAMLLIERALERDPKSSEAWGLRAELADRLGDRDDFVFSLNKQLTLLIAQKAPKKDIAALRERVVTVDPIAADVFKLRGDFIAKLRPIAEQYDKDERPHAAIRVWREILALDPELEDAQKAIERISALPDPSLAGSAKPKDLLADVSRQWIQEHDAKHSDWKSVAVLERENYVTKTDAGYEVLVRSAEAMEQMNRFYRRFFKYGYGKDKRTPPKIALHVFKNRDEYLKLGQGPPVEWSGGQFTGSAVETYVGPGGYEEVVTTLFHEAAHQFVSLATTAAGWLNEGLASFFEGCRILANGTVLMNMPANHRLFPLVQRMNVGWMESATDGIDPANASAEPTKAPTFRIVLENEYGWGPPWYAPTWGVVYFLYNYQDPADGRFVYRKAFGEFIDASGGRIGKGAIENFEKVVLQNPQRPTQGLPSTAALKLPRTVDELNEVWKEWLVALADEQSGAAKPDRPYLDWARYAQKRNEDDVATEHFEKGYVATPDDTELLLEFAEHLAKAEGNTDRAAKLVLEALRVVESAQPIDEKLQRRLESRLNEWDPKRVALAYIHEKLNDVADTLVRRYVSDKLPMMAMELSWRFGTELNVPGMFEIFEEAARQTTRSIQLWQLAYNEVDLRGWTAGGDVWLPYGAELRSKLGEYTENTFDFNALSYDTVTSGDFSMEVEVYAERGRSSFCGVMFGKKGAQTFQAVVLHPGHAADEETGRLERQGRLDVSSFFGAGSSQLHRQSQVDTSKRDWHKIRVDVTDTLVDVFFDGGFIVTHDFGSQDPLRGGFGLMTGPGTASFRNIRFLARDRRDPGAAIERRLRFEKLEKDSKGGSINGSWQNKAAPFCAATWLQGERTSFVEKGPVPTLLVFASIDQMKSKLPIAAWLRGLAKQHEPIGLEVVTVFQNADARELPEYLKTEALPGSVAIDYRPQGRAGQGDWFTAYDIKRFGMPRLILIDIDGKVAWEGDPGMVAGEAWSEGAPSNLDQPLDQMIARRRLLDLKRWLKAWETEGSPALERGDVLPILPLILRARELPGRQVPLVADVQHWLSSFEGSLAHPKALLDAVAAAGAEPALKTLLEWADAAKLSMDADARKAIKDAQVGATMKDWATALAECQKAAKAWKEGSEWSLVSQLMGSLSRLSGALPKDLAQELEYAAANRDAAEAKRLIDEAALRPGFWLVQALADQ